MKMEYLLVLLVIGVMLVGCSGNKKEGYLLKEDSVLVGQIETNREANKRVEWKYYNDDSKTLKIQIFQDDEIVYESEEESGQFKLEDNWKYQMKFVNSSSEKLTFDIECKYKYTTSIGIMTMTQEKNVKLK